MGSSSDPIIPDDQVVGSRPLRAHFFEDLAWAIQLGVPISIGNSAKVAQKLALSLLLARYSTKLAASIAVAGIWCDWMDFALLTSQYQTAALCGNALGAKNHKLVGIWLQIALVFVTVLSPLVFAVRAATTPIMDFVGVPADIGHPAGVFAVWSSLSLLFECWYCAVQAYYAGQGIVVPDAVIGVTYIFVCIALTYVGVYHFGLGVYGVALVLSVKRFLRVTTLVIVSWKMGLADNTWFGWDFKETFKGFRWRIYIPAAGMSGIGGAMETVTFGLAALIAARLGPALSTAFDLTILLYILLLNQIGAVATGFSIPMSQYNGAGMAARAKEVIKSAVICVYGTVLVCSFILYAMWPFYAEFATHDEHVRKQILSLRYLVPIQFGACSGISLMMEILFKQGRPGVVTVVCSPLNWFIGVPIAFFAARTILTSDELRYSMTPCPSARGGTLL